MTIVYTFIVGDLFHVNHVRILELAKTFGDYLIVGVLSDEAVESYKRKPIYSLEDRVKIVNSLKCVDKVVIQYSRSPLEVIKDKDLNIDIVVHADDWKYNFPDRLKIEELGVKVVLTPYFDGMSTTKAIRKIKETINKGYGNEDSLKEALFAFKDLMDEHGIKFALESGTLLGAFRNRRLLPWDVDIDACVVFDSYEEFVNTDIFDLVRSAQKKGFKDARWAHEFVIDRGYIKYPQIAAMAEKDQWKEFLKIDPVWRSERFGMHWKCSNGLEIRIDCLVSIKDIHDTYERYYSNENGRQEFDELILYGEKFYVPPNPMRYILDHYGDTWKDIYCSYDLWLKHRDELIKGNIPEEVRDFMNKRRPLLDDNIEDKE